LLFTVLWLCTIPDEEEQTLSLPIYDGDLKRATANQLPASEMGTKLGELRVKVTFWRGLGRAHHRLAARDFTVGEIMDVIQAVHDTHDTEVTVGTHGWQGGDDGEHDDSDNDSDDTGRGHGHGHGHGNSHGRFSTDGASTTGGYDERHDTQSSANARRGSTESKRHSGSSFISDIKNYRRNKDQLHRQGRGAMQWKVPRTMAWMKHKTEHAAEKVRDQFHHSERQPGIETEV